MQIQANFRRNFLCAAVLAALACPAIAQETGQSPLTTLGEVSVTGSRIKRADVEAALPITIVKKAEIEAQGITSAEQLMQFLNIAGNGSDGLTSAAVDMDLGELRGTSGVSGANLRGQGSDATLVLLNGRRVATQGLRGQAVDLNSIPFAAIDRVEILRDGASAVYGTDAVGGVINFITRSDYRGVTVNADADVTQEGGGNIYNFSVLGGIGNLDTDRWNAWGTVNYRRSEFLRSYQRDFANSFQPDRGVSPDTRGTPFATVTNAAGGIISAPLPDPAGGGGQRYINILNLPGGGGCANGGPNMGPYDYRLWDGSSSKYACAWDYPAAQALQQPLESMQALGRATFKFGENSQFYAEAMGSRVVSRREYEPLQLSSSASATAVLDPSTWYPLNADTQATYDKIFNALAGYFGTDNLVYGNKIPYRWRCMVCGPKQIETTTKSYRVLAGLKGNIAAWDYDIGLSRASSEADSTLAGGYYFSSGLKQILGGGLLNPFLMPGQQQNPTAITALKDASATGVHLYGGESTVTSLDASFSGGLGFDLKGGEVQMATGGEVRREEFKFGGTQVLNGLPLNYNTIYQAPFDDTFDLPKVHRDVKAVYAEINLPILKTLEANIAARYDDYDTFGGTTNPKYSFKWQPIEDLAFRGAYSTNFKVPEFSMLFAGVNKVDYFGLDLADPATCPSGIANSSVSGCAMIQPTIITGGKADLQPEKAKQKSLGMIYAPSGSFNFTLDWWQIERTNTIRVPDQQTLITDYNLFSANWIRDSSGKVIAIDRRYINSGGTLMSGIEIDANLMGDLAGGRWHINLNGSYIDTFKEKPLANEPYGPNKVGQYVRFYNLPLKWKHTLNFTWGKGDWAHTLTQIYRAGYKDELPVSVDNGTYIPKNWNPDVDDYVTYNYSVTWTGLKNAKLTFVVRNILNTDPPFTAHQVDFAAGAAWEPRVADPRGRSFNLLGEYKFD
ncbi:TonB-dependent receptor plug domain-containing protein [Rudaea sp.]|uniref:TonB-dependent receptor plug domain-containing protein n=1 Tax=Rudaea sp. TaxID=2136325 RepID=UPI0037852957